MIYIYMITSFLTQQHNPHSVEVALHQRAMRIEVRLQLHVFMLYRTYYPEPTLDAENASHS